MKTECFDNHVISLPEFSLNTNTKFFQRIVDGKHLTLFQSETSVFKLLWCSVAPFRVLNRKTKDDRKLCVVLELLRYPLKRGFTRVLENLESPGILLWHFPGLESPGKRPLVLESSGNLLNSTKRSKRQRQLSNLFTVANSH